MQVLGGQRLISLRPARGGPVVHGSEPRFERQETDRLAVLENKQLFRPQIEDRTPILVKGDQRGGNRGDVDQAPTHASRLSPNLHVGRYRARGRIIGSLCTGGLKDRRREQQRQ